MRFFAAGAIALALLGRHLGRRRLVRAGALVAGAGVAAHLAGLTSGSAALLAAALCLWMAANGASSSSAFTEPERG